MPVLIDFDIIIDNRFHFGFQLEFVSFCSSRKLKLTGAPCPKIKVAD